MKVFILNDNKEILSFYLVKMTLLCVEDNKTIQLIYQSVFDIVFKNVIIASNGKEALEIIKNQHIDIIITDYNMPKMNGLEMLEVIRSLALDIPTVFVTAVEESSIVVNALNLGVHNFLYKPFDITELNESIESAAKIVIANQKLLEDQKQREQLLEERAYQTYQEELSFRKELTILRNDFYYQRDTGKHELLIDFLYLPLDILSGDAYSARRINEDLTLFFIVDGMGKGISASLSAMLLTSFMNHRIDMVIESGAEFDMHFIIERSILFMQKILLDDEILSAEFILMDEKNTTMHYALFSMPALLLHYEDDTVTRIKSNNPPISRHHNTINIDKISLVNVKKLLFLSDGLIENEVEGGLYIKYLENDFKNAFTRDEFKKMIFSRIKVPDDDITFIFLSYVDVKKTGLHEKTFSSNLPSVDEANAWFEASLKALNTPAKLLNKATLTFNELFMNAFEHGSLGIDSHQKEQLIKENTYIDYLQEASTDNTKQITVSLSKVSHQENAYMISSINDQGPGFDTQLLSTIFRNREKFNGKGVFISRKASDGIYYNNLGNSVVFIHRIR